MVDIHEKNVGVQSYTDACDQRIFIDKEDLADRCVFLTGMIQAAVCGKRAWFRLQKIGLQLEYTSPLPLSRCCHVIDTAIDT